MLQQILIYQTGSNGAFRVQQFAKDGKGFSRPSGPYIEVAAKNADKLYETIVRCLQRNATGRYRAHKASPSEVQRRLREDKLVGIERIPNKTTGQWTYTIVAYERYGSAFRSIAEINVSERKFAKDTVQIVLNAFERIP